MRDTEKTCSNSGALGFYDGGTIDMIWLVLWNMFFFHILGMSKSQLTFIFFRGVGIPPTSDEMTCRITCSSVTSPWWCGSTRANVISRAGSSSLTTKKTP